MKFTITRDNLRKGLAAVAGSVPTRTTLPVLSNLLLEADGDGVRISGTDLDTGVSVRVPGEVEEEGAITAPAKKLQEIARELPSHPVEISTRGEIVSLHCGKSRFRLNGLPRDEFPDFPTVDFSQRWSLDGGQLRTLISRVSFAVSTEETRPILNGVLWQIGDGEMRMVATNGHRLAKMSQPLESANGAGEAELIVHPRALNQVTKLFDEGDRIEVARSENHLVFRGEDVNIFTRLIEGPYPNYEQVIPRDNDKVLVADREALNAAVRRMAIVASDQTHRVRLAMSGSTLKFSVQTPDLGEASEEMSVDYDGDALEIGFNANYLLEVLRYIPADEVRLSFKAPERAAILEPVGSVPGEGGATTVAAPDFLCLVMPLRLMD